MDDRKEELIFARRLEELAKSAYYKNICVYTDFLNLNEISIFHRSKKDFPELPYSMYGGFEGAERVRLCFHGDAEGSGELVLSEEQKEEYPISCIRIEPANIKFAENLTHRDYLGAILNLGLDRSTTGDILVREDAAYLYCDPVIGGFLLENLEKIRHTNVRLSRHEKSDPGDGTGCSFETIHATVASLRLDALVGAAFHSSRSSMAGLIPGGKVFVNGREALQGSLQIRPQDIVSVRGYGRFRLSEEGTRTKKGRINVTLEKYV
ncbi:MAG: RNA-binding protein [Lachnospiraceae bacterium]|nr:RNA-binding protein [Lachnospiraceae bacterium]